jgi:hypothetical protein
LIIKNKTSKTITASACNSYTSPSGKYIWVTSGTYKDTISNAAGCDSIITTNLTIKNKTSKTITASACTSYISPSGKYSWTSSGIYNDTISNAAGCDSIITTNLTIKNKTSKTITTSVCNRYASPSGKYSWTSSGIYQDTLANASGCDSLLTVNLTVKIVKFDTTVVQSGINLTSNDTLATYQWLDCDKKFRSIIGETNKSCTFSATGNYAVELSINGCRDTSSCQYVTVDCFSHFTTSYDTTKNIFILVVDSATAGFAGSYVWNFGDGSASLDANPSHTYTNDTVYNVCLKIHTNTNVYCSYCHEIGKDHLGNIYRTKRILYSSCNSKSENNSKYSFRSYFSFIN